MGLTGPQSMQYLGPRMDNPNPPQCINCLHYRSTSPSRCYSPRYTLVGDGTDPEIVCRWARSAGSQCGPEARFFEPRVPTAVEFFEQEEQLTAKRQCPFDGTYLLAKLVAAHGVGMFGLNEIERDALYAHFAGTTLTTHPSAASLLRIGLQALCNNAKDSVWVFVAKALLVDRVVAAELVRRLKLKY